MKKEKIWTQERLDEAKKLLQTTSASKAAVIMGVASKNAILGALYREKEKNGFVEKDVDTCQPRPFIVSLHVLFVCVLHYVHFLFRSRR